MPFTRPIPKPVCPCGAPAEMQVVDHYQPVGCFCQACANREVQRRISEEARTVHPSEPPGDYAGYRDVFRVKAQLQGHD